MVMKIDIKKLEYLDLNVFKSIKEDINEESNYKVSENEAYSYIAKVNDELVGFIYGKIKENNNITESKYIKIEDIYVKPRNRNQGIGKKLLDSMIFEAKDKGISGAFINGSCEEVTQTINLYNKLGCRSWYIQMF
jgi:GNAT superfamily N-acetyltransferase